MIDVARLKKEEGNKYSKTMRVHYRIYDELSKLKAIYGEQHEIPKVTFNEFLLECCNVGEALLTGEELYEANGKLFHDVESARGEAILQSTRTGKPAVPPRILLKLGKDGLLK